jgi:hypothetical protein
LIGINLNGYGVEELKRAVEKEKLTWRSFADPGRLGHGAIATRWNVSFTPTYYVIDHRGVIRHKWLGAPGEALIDRSLEKLIAEAEADAKRPVK